LVSKTKSNNYVYYFLIFVLVIALLASAYLAQQRVYLEQANKYVEVTLDSQEIERLSRYSPYSEQELLRQFREIGVSSILLREQIISDLESHKAWVLSGNQILIDDRYRAVLGNNIDTIRSGYNYIITTDERVHEQIAKNISRKIFNAHIPESNGNIQFVGVPITRAELSSIGLGFDRDFIDMAVSEGYNLLVQIRNWPQSSPEAIKGVFEYLQPYRENITAVFFNDYIIPGLPDYLYLINEGIESLDANFAFVESFIFNQRGARQIGLEEQTNVVRLHAISVGEMVNMTPQRAVDRFTLAISDRNVRVILVRFFFPMDTSNWIETNIEYLGGGEGFIGLIPAIERAGFSIDAAQPFHSHVVSTETRMLLIFLSGLGVLAGGMLLLRRLDLSKLGYLLGAAGLAIWVLAFLVDFVLNINILNMATKAMALGSVIVFPSFAVISVLNDKPCTSIGKAAVKLIQMSLISLMGALIMVGLLAHLNFMLKLDQFIGVKIAHILPIALVVFTFYLWQDRDNLPARIKDLLDRVITNKYLILAGVILIVGFVYISRTGNEMAVVSDLELRIRSLLNDLLIARPRTQEFLIGHPVMLLMLYLGYKHRYLPLLALGVIGQISMVNTFAHVHTPLIISMIRTVNGLWLGIAIGIVLILLWRYYKRWEGRFFNE